LLRRLAREEIISLLVEGGGEVLGSVFDGGFADRVCWFVSPIVIGSHRSRSAVAGRGVERLGDAWSLRDVSIEPVGKSFLIRGNLSRWALATPGKP
jgi:diaminohydroxyphosphoribosylaminopyrimidine deaminase/5-amino-6-(5-phosphoribosylamino)uracil reductase